MPWQTQQRMNLSLLQQVLPGGLLYHPPPTMCNNWNFIFYCDRRAEQGSALEGEGMEKKRGGVLKRRHHSGFNKYGTMIAESMLFIKTQGF